MGRIKASWLRLQQACLIVASLSFVWEPVSGHHTYARRKLQDSISSASTLDKIIPFPPNIRPPNTPGTDTILPVYPLDPLTALEIHTAALVIRAANRTSNLQFPCIGLNEPEKASLVQYFLSGTNPPVGKFDRKAQVLVVDPTTQAPAWTIVNLDTLKIESWTDARPDQHTADIPDDDQTTATNIAFSDPAVVARINALGFNDLSKIITDVWESGCVADNPVYAQVRKLVQIFFYVYLGNGDNFYAHPLDFVVYVDLGAQVVRGIENLPIQEGFDRNNRTGNSVPLGSSSNYFPDSLFPPNSLRTDVRPIAISRPNGVSFQVEDRIVTWQNFRFHVGYNPREGLYINHVTYNDQGSVRPLFYRMSISESYVYYGDPRPPYQRKISYDEGNFELGTNSQSLSSEFCRGQAHYFDSVIHNSEAVTTLVEKSTCIFEEDAGPLWAHFDSASGRTAVTRSQRLSISSLVTIGNIDYFHSWRFYQDATVELSLRLTGILSTNLLAVDVKAPPYGNLMTPQVYAENFQYFIGARIDTDIDGVSNTVSMEDIVSVPPAQSPFGNGITTQSKVLQQVQDAPSDIQPGRTWRVSNPNAAPHPVTGKQPSWKLMPQGPNMPNLLQPYYPHRNLRISYADRNMWVLPFDDNQIFIDGLYLDSGVSQWTNESLTANLENTDVVLWHVFGLAFIPDPEDWPIVSSIPDTVGFRLRPSNFFLLNPGVTVPPASQTTAYDDNRKNSDNNGWTPGPRP